MGCGATMPDRAPVYPTASQRRALAVLLKALGKTRPVALRADYWRACVPLIRRGETDKLLRELSGHVERSFCVAIAALGHAHRPTHSPHGYDAYGVVAFERCRDYISSVSQQEWGATERAFATAMRSQAAPRSLSLRDATVVALYRTALGFRGTNTEQVTSATGIPIGRAKAAFRGDDTEAAMEALRALGVSQIDKVLSDTVALAEGMVRKGGGVDASADWWPWISANFGEENANAILRSAAVFILHRATVRP